MEHCKRGRNGEGGKKWWREKKMVKGKKNGEEGKKNDTRDGI